MSIIGINNFKYGFNMALILQKLPHVSSEACRENHACAAMIIKRWIIAQINCNLGLPALVSSRTIRALF
jgi:hypothetical protein